MEKLKLAPEQASNFAHEYDIYFWLLSGLTVFFTIVVFVIAYTFVHRYRRGKVADRSNPVHHNVKLEVLLLTVPTGLALAMFAWGAKIFVSMREVPDNAMEIFVVGKRWMWHVQHQNGIRENNELHVPLGQPIKITMISQDVIHGFYIPQFRVQYMAVPGRYTYLWFTPTKPGRYNLFCTIHCGTQHSEMGGYVYVMPPAEWAKWKESGGNRYKPVPTNMVEAGKQLWDDNKCMTCHEASDTRKGPSLNNVYGKTIVMEDGTTAAADRAFLRESLQQPYARVHKGYEVSMPEYKDLTEDQINQLIEYMKTLGMTPPPPPAPTAGLDHRDNYQPQPTPLDHRDITMRGQR